MNDEIRNEMESTEVMETETPMDYTYENPEEPNNGNFGTGMLFGMVIGAGAVAGTKLVKKAYKFGKKRWEEHKEKKESKEDDNVIEADFTVVTNGVEEDEKK